jgi:hypothetical protein
MNSVLFVLVGWLVGCAVRLKLRCLLALDVVVYKTTCIVFWMLIYCCSHWW